MNKPLIQIRSKGRWRDGENEIRGRFQHSNLAPFWLRGLLHFSLFLATNKILKCDSKFNSILTLFHVLYRFACRKIKILQIFMKFFLSSSPRMAFRTTWEFELFAQLRKGNDSSRHNVEEFLWNLDNSNKSPRELADKLTSTAFLCTI